MRWEDPSFLKNLILTMMQQQQQQQPYQGQQQMQQRLQQQAVQRQQRSYAMTAPKQQISKDSACYEGMLGCLGFVCGSIGIILPCCFPNPFKKVQQGNVGLVCRFGRFVKSVDPGLYKINPLCEKISTVDIRMRVQDIPRQIALTRDNVAVEIDSVLYWDVLNPYTANFLVSNVTKALIDRTQTTLRMVLGNRTLQETLEHRDSVAQEIRDIIDQVAESWGVRVEAILIKDVVLGPELLANMSSAATQKRIGESKIIQAQAEVNSAKLMREAADILASPAAMQIRYLETLTQMSSTSGTRIVFLPPNAGGSSGGLSVQDAAIYEVISDRK